ncbi:AMP-binding protein [Thioclava indica]|uniref:AMP-binding protein n=1 Tax=Thioclava indica TaxID=1353528 RepID=A0A074JPH1_9RHOB|nr:AMP-binding protein [Thioclava indica]KEO57508.1 hypothetical protein DT23_05410 [Thioclava indica]
MTTPVTAGRPGYAEAMAQFSLENAKSLLSSDLETGLNACVECCDRHVASGRTALTWIAADGRIETYSFADLQAMAARAANVFSEAGVQPGDVVSGLLTRTPELMATVLGAWRVGAAYQPLFTAFGPKAIEQRLTTSRARLVVTDSANRAKLDSVPNAPQVALVRARDADLPSGDIDLRAAMAAAKPDFTPVMRHGSDLMLMMSTSGTTGAPKGVPVPLRALMSFAIYMRDAVELREDDTFWNIADPGWAYGLYYAVTGPLALGRGTTFYEGGFSAETTYDLIEKLGVTNLAGSPTAFRLLIAAGPEAAARVKGKLRAVSSAGEPLNPEVIRWFEEHLAVPIHDHYGQTELGMVVNNHHGLEHPVRPGSAGFAMPGYRVAVLDPEGNELPTNQPGDLAVDIARSPLLWFTGYHGKPTPEIGGGYYRTGDSVEFAADGSLSFVGRADDVITSSGYRIGPFDVESALLEHPAVMETAVVGVPDPERTEIVKAFVILNKDVQGSDALAEELRLHVKTRLSAHAYPRAIDFVSELPKTPSGKIQRFLLRRAEIAKLDTV